MNEVSFLHVYMPFIIWFFGIIITFAILMARFPLNKKWSKENPNPYAHETFAMPRGVLRGVLTLSLLFIVLLLEVVNIFDKNLEQTSEQLIVAFQMMLAFYFGSKVMHHVTSADKNKNKELTIVSETSQVQTPQVQTVMAAGPQPQKKEAEFEDSRAKG